jgi:hypothetical protein
MSSLFQLRRRRAVLVGIALAGLLATGLLVFHFIVEGCSPGFDVVVRNDGSVLIQDAHLWFRSGLVGIPPIAPGHKVSVRVKPTSEGDLELEFSRGIGDYRHGDIVCLDYDERGTVALAIDDQGTIHCQYHKVPSWPSLWARGVDGSLAIATSQSATPIVAPWSTEPPPRSGLLPQTKR